MHITRAWLEEASNAGLIALTGASGGPVDMALKEGHAAQAKERLLTLKSLFGDRLYIELQRQSGYDRSHERRLIGLAYEHDIPSLPPTRRFSRPRRTMRHMMH